MKLLITGGSSFLGQHLVPLAQEKHEIAYTFYSQDPLGWGQKLDLRDKKETDRLIQWFQPDAIIHLAGSNRSAEMTSLITNAAKHLSSHNIRLIHLSSDVIFDGTAAPYTESARPNPVHEYGRAKAEAETIVSVHPNHVIVRTSLIYSDRIIDRGTEWMSQAIAEGKPLTLFTDHVRNPVHADDLSNSCLELAGNDYVGILNVAGSESISRADFSAKMLQFWGFELTDTVKFGADETGKFPKDCRLEITLAQSLLKTNLRPISTLR